LVDDVLPAIADISDPVLQAHYLQRLSRLARTSEDALRRSMPRNRAARRRQDAPQEAAPTAISRSRAANLRAPREEYCLALLYRSAGLRPLAEQLEDELFGLSENREILRRWRLNEAIHEEDGAIWEHFQRVQETRIPTTETSELEEAFLDCVARLRLARMKAIKEASALALAEGEARTRPGQVASFAHSQLGPGSLEDATADESTREVATQLLDDMEAGLRFHQRPQDQQGSGKGPPAVDL
jgi:DNA primase